METQFIERSFGIVAYDPWSGKSIIYPKKENAIVAIKTKPESVVMVSIRFFGDKRTYSFFTTKEEAERFLMESTIEELIKSVSILD